jgi:nucleotide-binding universal stress UspA family protein
MHILVGTDLSPRARDALKWAIDLRRHRQQQHSADTNISVAHVVEPDVERSSELNENGRLKSVEEEIQMAGGTSSECNIEIHKGSPREALQTAAKQKDADLLTVSLTGRGAFGKLVAGSTALGLSHNPPCPMTLCHHESNRYSKLNGICVGVDFSESSDRASQLAYELGNKKGTRLHFVHVTKPDPYAPGPVITRPADDESSIMTEDIEDARTKLRNNVRKNLGDDAVENATLDIVRGYPSRSLIHYARQKDCDAIAVSAKGRTAMGDFFAGSVAHGIIRQAPCHILLAQGA